MNKLTDKFLQYTIETWQPYFYKKLNKKDAVEIIDNMTRFFTLLIETNHKGRR